MNDVNDGTNDRALRVMDTTATAPTPGSRVVVSGPHDKNIATALLRSAFTMLLVALRVPATVYRTAIADFLEICASSSVMLRTEASCRPKMHWKLHG